MDNQPTMPREPAASPKQSPAAGPKAAPRLGRDAAVAAICGLVVVLMVGASYAAVPFYNWFCRATGFNGTTQVATSAPPSAPPGRKNAGRFDAKVRPGPPREIEPSKD